MKSKSKKKRPARQAADINNKGAVRALVAELTPKRLLLLAATAAMLVLAFPSAGLFPLVWVALVPLFWVIYEGRPEYAFAFGFLCQFAAKIGTLYWLVYTMNYFGHISLLPSILILLLLVSFLGSFYGLACMAIVRLSRQGKWPLALIAPAAWIAAEWIQGWFFTGFPWAYLGYAPYRWLTAVQAADLLGVWGLTVLAVLVNVAVFEIIRYALKKRPTFPWAVAPAAALLFAGSLIYGHFRLAQVQEAQAVAPAIRVGVVQGNVPQDEKWTPQFKMKAVGIYLDLIARASEQGAALVLTPETSIPLWVDRGVGVRKNMQRLATESGVHVLMGCPSYTREGQDEEHDVNFNSAVLMGPEGQDLGWYDKNHLVPFGEYIPYKEDLRKLLGSLVHGTGDFHSSGKINLMNYPPAPFGVLICYEAIFPNLARRIANLGSGAAFFANITNDAWFGDTSAPHQHLMMVAMRAIENRLYVARAANTGISSFIDATGKILYESPVFKTTSYVDEVRIMKIGSVYRVVGDVVVWASLALLAVAAVAVVIANRRARRGRIEK